MKNKYYIKRIIIPSLQLDFDIFAQEKDKDQLDIFINIGLSIWSKTGKGEIKVYDYLGAMRAENEK